jgi:hypothetical protein
MKTVPQHIAQVCLTLWLGGMWTTAYLAVPQLFHSLSDRQLAGLLAGQLLSNMAWLGILCATYLFALQIVQHGKTCWKNEQFRLIGVMLILILISHFGIQPYMVALKAHVAPLDIMQSTLAGQFKQWHGIASILYLLNSLLGIRLLLIFNKII